MVLKTKSGPPAVEPLSIWWLPTLCFVFSVKDRCYNGTCINEAHTKSFAGVGRRNLHNKSMFLFSYLVWTDENFTADYLLGTISLDDFQALL